MKLKILATLVFGSFLAAGGASASTFYLQKQGSGYFDGGGKQAVTIQYGRHSENVYAGGFQLKYAGDNIVAWCLDITRNLNVDKLYTTTATPFQNTTGAIAAGTLANIKKLFETSYSTLDLTNNSQSAGFQLALWEILYERSGAYDLTNGMFSANSSRYRGAGSAIREANTLLASLTGPIVQNYKYTFFESQHSQNLVSVSPVPLPAAGWLLGGGLIGLYGLSRRKKARSKASLKTA